MIYVPTMFFIFQKLSKTVFEVKSNQSCSLVEDKKIFNNAVKPITLIISIILLSGVPHLASFILIFSLV
jgi:hypothetical protein